MKISRKNLRQLIEAYIAGEDPSQVYKADVAYERAKDKIIKAINAISPGKGEKIFKSDPKQALALASSFKAFSPEEEASIGMGQERAYDEVYDDEGIESLGPTSMSPASQEIYHYSNDDTEHVIDLEISKKKAGDVILSFLDRNVQEYLRKDMVNYGAVQAMLDGPDSIAKEKFLKWMDASKALDLHMENELKTINPNVAASGWSMGDTNNKILEIAMEWYIRYG